MVVPSFIKKQSIKYTGNITRLKLTAIPSFEMNSRMSTKSELYDPIIKYIITVIKSAQQTVSISNLKNVIILIVF